MTAEVKPVAEGCIQVRARGKDSGDEEKREQDEEEGREAGDSVEQSDGDLHLQ